MQATRTPYLRRVASAAYGRAACRTAALLTVVGAEQAVVQLEAAQLLTLGVHATREPVDPVRAFITLEAPQRFTACTLVTVIHAHRRVIIIDDVGRSGLNLRLNQN